MDFRTLITTHVTAWARGEWGKARWEKPVEAEAEATQTCQKCQCAFVSATKSALCPDCS